MRLSTAEGSLYFVMVGIGETYFVPFALAIGYGETMAGLLAAVPPLIGSIVQLVSTWGIQAVGSMRRWMLIGSALQALSFVPLIVGAIVGWLPVWLLFLLAAVYHTANMAQGPAWSAWITTLVPRRVRSKYFGRRTAIMQGGVLAGTVAGGLVLGDGDPAVARFAWLFGGACLIRFICMRLLAMHAEPVPLPSSYRHVGAGELKSRLSTGADVRLMAYMLIGVLVQAIAHPFFVPYIIDERGLGEQKFMFLVSAAILGRMVASHHLGDLAHRYGARRVYWIGMITTAPISAFWALAGSFELLLVIQFLSGFAFGAAELGAMLLRYETIPEHERSSLMATFNCLSGVAMLIGSLLGAWVLSALDESFAGYAVVFGLCAAFRVLLVPALALVPAEVRHPRELPVRPIGADPSSGERTRAELPAISETESERPERE